MDKLKVMTIIGTRPEIIRLSECIKAFDKHFSHVLVHTGQNWDYTLNQIFFEELGLNSPDYFLDCVGNNLGSTMGNIIAKAYDILLRENPDAVVILGDTNSALSAIPAKRLKIPIFHMEAGNRCFDLNVPEEINRRIVDHISDINLAYTEHSRRYLISEGIKKEHIFVTGSPLVEVFRRHLDKVNKSDVLTRLNLKKNEFFLVSAHREENIDNEQNFFSLMEGLNYIAETYSLPVIYSTHPRSRSYLEKRKFKFHPLIKSIEPFGFIDYNHLQMNSFCVLSDSGTLSEESSILGFSGVLLRTSTERPEVFDKGVIVIGGISGIEMKQAIDVVTDIPIDKSNISMPLDYSDDNVSIKVVKIIQSYTKIINKVNWGKSIVHSQ